MLFHCHASFFYASVCTWLLEWDRGLILGNKPDYKLMMKPPQLAYCTRSCFLGHILYRSWSEQRRLVNLVNMAFLFDNQREIPSSFIGPYTYGNTPWKEKEIIAAADAEQLLQVVLPSLLSSVFKNSPGDSDCCMHNKFFLLCIWKQ